MPLNKKIKFYSFNIYPLYIETIFKICFMCHKYKYIFLVLFLFKANTSLAQSVSSNVTIISSPEKTVAASAQSGANTLQVINSYGLGLASTINLSWISLALGLAVASVWDGDSGGKNNSTSSSTTN